jgi:hypothetical protein
MNDEKVLIINYLKCSPGAWFGKKEIARRAVKRRAFDDNPRWADEPIAELVAQKVIEENKDGQVRLKKEDSN